MTCEATHRGCYCDAIVHVYWTRLGSGRYVCMFVCACIGVGVSVCGVCTCMHGEYVGIGANMCHVLACTNHCFPRSQAVTILLQLDGE